MQDEARETRLPPHFSSRTAPSSWARPLSALVVSLGRNEPFVSRHALSDGIFTRFRDIEGNLQDRQDRSETYGLTMRTIASIPFFA